MENSLSTFENFEKAGINPQIKSFLLEIAKWSKFLAILGFVGIGIMVLFGLFFGSVMSKMPGGNPYSELGIGAGFLGFVYILIALLYFMPILYLFNFSTKMKKAIHGNNEELLTESFSNLKSHYKFIGIFMIIVLSIYALMFLVGLLGFMM